MANTSLHDNAPHLPATEARQASRGRHLLTVLVASVTLAVIALGLAWAWQAGAFHRADVRADARAAAAAPAAATAAPTSPASTGLNQ